MEATTSPGRPREFDPDEVLDVAVEVFWRRGPESTSMRDLEAELGISQSSIYNSFGSKGDLFNAALDRYEQRVHDELVAPLEAGGVDAVLDFLDSLLGWITDDGHRGCLVTNLMASRSEDRDVAQRTRGFRDRMRQALAGALRCEPGLSGDEADAQAELVLTAALGLSVSASGGAATAELAGMIEATKTVVAPDRCTNRSIADQQ